MCCGSISSSDFSSGLIATFGSTRCSVFKMRVMRRVGKETEGLFRAQFGVSLVKALEAGDDEEKWAASGANLSLP